MKFGNLFRLTIAAVAVGLAASAAHAGPQYFFGSTPGVSALPEPSVPETNATLRQQKAFTEAVDPASIKTETFESATPGDLGITAKELLSIFDGNGTVSQDAIPLVPPITGDPLYSGPKLLGEAGQGRFNTTSGGSKFFETDWTFTVEVEKDVNAFAFFGTDFGDFAGELQIELWLDGLKKASNVFLDPASTDPDKKPQLLDSPGSGSVLFFGFTTNDYKFDQLVFRINQKDLTRPETFDTLGFDDLRVANLKASIDPSPVPEPGSLALAGLALLAAGWARKTQRRA